MLASCAGQKKYCFYFVSVTVRMVLEAFLCFWAICACVPVYVIICYKSVIVISYKLLCVFDRIYNFGAVGHKGELIC